MPPDTRLRPFRQVDVFTDVAYRGNPVAVVLDAEGLDDAAMQRFADWTNLSETTFVLPPTNEGADYRVRIFTPTQELPFAGHPTLGTCHAWLEQGGRPHREGVVVQECAAGRVEVRRSDGRLAFSAPPLVREGPLDDALFERVLAMLRLDRSAVVDAAWVDNGPGWIGVLLASAEEVLAVRPAADTLFVGVAGPHPADSPEAWEVRAFFPKSGTTAEDPVTGSFNASLAGWLLRTGRARAPWRARQGTAMGRAGIVHVDADADGRLWIGGGTTTCVAGDVRL